MSEDDANHFVVRCRGLPWSTTVDEIMNFFGDCQFKDGENSVHMTLTREGRPSGEAYIELASEDDLETALGLDRKNMGKRYIEVFKSKYSEMDWVVKRSGRGNESGFEQDSNNGPQEEAVVRLRGLPFDSTKMDIVKFFDGMEITNNGILMTTDYQGRSSGEAYVQFASRSDAERALEKNKQSIGHRYIEVFRSSMMEAQRAQFGGGQGGGYGGRGGRRGGGGGGRDYDGGYGGRGGRQSSRPGPYDRNNGPPLGRGFGPNGPGSRGPRGMKDFGGGNDNYGGGFGGGNRGGFGDYSDDGGFGMGFGNNGGGRMGGGGGGGFGNGGGYNGGNGGSGGGFGRGFGGGNGPVHIVHMRGLPYRVSENDIAEWFSSVVDPMDISIIYNNQGRPTGEADVMFQTESDAQKAMSKDRQNMQHRYIELFYDGAQGGGSGGQGGGGRNVGGAAYSTGSGAFGSRGGNGFGNGFARNY